MKKIASALLVLLILAPCAQAEKPNVLLIICDDLNDYEGSFGGHPQARTPNIDRLAQSGTVFANAHSGAPVCAPSRASFFTGIYPHHSKNYGFFKWYKNPMLRKSTTLMKHMQNNGYFTLGAGKLMHHSLKKEWMEFGPKHYHGPVAYDGKKPAGHPSVPAGYSGQGLLDGTFASLADVPNAGYNGWWDSQKNKPFNYVNDGERSAMRDEQIAAWAVKRIGELDRQKDAKPFFMAIGFSKPHTPLVAPQKYFDLFPLETLQLPAIKKGDADDCHLAGNIPDDSKGFRFYRAMCESFPDFETGLRRYVQAYLACVAFADDQVGKVLDALDHSRFKNNTIVVFTSDHGYNLGQKEYLFKNSLWEESTRVPFIIRAPGTKAGQHVDHPVGLIDLYPTLVDLCGLSRAKVDGHSMKPFLSNPAGPWDGPGVVLTVVYAKTESLKPADQHYAVRSKHWRYIRYANGDEELYDHRNDPHEWTNLASNPEFKQQKEKLKRQMAELVPGLGK